MNAAKTTLGILMFAVLLVILASVFTITQGQHGIVLRLGRLVTDSKTHTVKILGPGLHIKTPFIENVRVFDTRLQTLDIKSSRIVTKEKKDVIVDYYVKWRIADLAQYFKSTGGNEFKAETLLEQQLNTLLRAEFGKRTISDVSGGRDDVTEKLSEKAEQQAKELGIKIVDVRIKGIELPENTSNNIFQLMRANMQKIANSHRADGNAIAEAIKAAADAQVTILLAQAGSEGQKIRAKGQAEAAKIYAEAFSKNQDFFAFYRSLKAYEGSFNNKQDILVLDQSSPFFDYFKHSLTKGNGTNAKN
ncbi:protease modulator HflC [Legionella brunensis]|uniref:Protein HflC n=1 Tax=Legionella brunensis TaxID=29422 RepID=A0A0W0S3R0_9GAMM|nr:protease modulator HflC [Legionella brunensis]KTC78108.1 HflC protein [Legionella brunensis]